MHDVDESIRAVETGLGYRFTDIDLLVDALTHSSFANEKPGVARTDNERLEFLGDAVLQWAISVLLWDLFPGASAGDMTRRRAELVCEEGLWDLARAIDVGTALRLGKGEARSGGRDKPRLLSSAFEACIAAVYLDGGEAAAMDTCRRLFTERAQCGTAGARDFKTRLQEELQQQNRALPRYELLARRGPDHEGQFEVALQLEGEEISRASGRSKIEAEQAAAKMALFVVVAARRDAPEGDMRDGDTESDCSELDERPVGDE